MARRTMGMGRNNNDSNMSNKNKSQKDLIDEGINLTRTIIAKQEKALNHSKDRDSDDSLEVNPIMMKLEMES